MAYEHFMPMSKYIDEKKHKHPIKKEEVHKRKLTSEERLNLQKHR